MVLFSLGSSLFWELPPSHLRILTYRTMAIYVERFIAEFARRLSVTAILQQSDSKISFTQGEFRPRCSQVDHHRNLCGTDVFKIIYRKIMPAYSKQKTTKFRSSETVHLDRKSTLFFSLPLCIIFIALFLLIYMYYLCYHYHL